MNDLRDKLPTDEVMRMMAKLAVEQATQSFADMADKIAADPRMLKVTGREALQAFAATIRTTNTVLYPTAPARAAK